MRRLHRLKRLAQRLRAASLRRPAAAGRPPRPALRGLSSATPHPS